MRGEDTRLPFANDSATGSPPHARGRLEGPKPIDLHDGITPACAGKTRPIALIAELLEDHPRMRGEDDDVPHAVPLL